MAHLPNSGRINASNPCVTGDTRVLTPGGVWRRIDQMIHIPGRIVTAKLGPGNPLHRRSIPDRHAGCVRAAHRRRISPDAHRRSQGAGPNRGWVAAENLRESDEIKLPSEPACAGDIGEPTDAKFFQLLGLYVSCERQPTLRSDLEQCLADAPQGER